MNRLTKKQENQLSCHHYKKCDYLRNGTPRVETLTKLGKLEDIEEQLGCPLDVAFQKCEEFEKENQYNFYCICKWYDEWVILEIDISIIGEFECNAICFLSEYQKTWWLKGEKHND